MSAPYISVVVPMYDEADSLHELHRRLVDTLEPYGGFEIVYVNDGSRDNSGEIIEELRENDPERVQTIHFRRNCGKSLALQAGFQTVEGKYVVMIDSDLQDHPEDIPRFIAKLEQGDCDVVTGWKTDRKDPYYSKVLPSRAINWLVRKLTGLKVHDINCGFKAMRRECLSSLNLYGQLHRFMLVLLSGYGFRVTEIPVENSARRFGNSKFGPGRIYYGFMDLLTAFFLSRYMNSPLYFFGVSGMLCIALSIPIGIYYIGSHYLLYIAAGFKQFQLAEHPLWLFSPALFILGLIMLFFGLLGEMLVNLLKAPDDYNAFISKRSSRED